MKVYYIQNYEVLSSTKEEMESSVWDSSYFESEEEALLIAKKLLSSTISELQEKIEKVCFRLDELYQDRQNNLG